MPTTSHFPASPAQLRFISALRQERGLAPLTDDEAASLTGGRTGTASLAISELQRMAVTPATISRATRSGSATPIPAPSQQVRAGRMLAAGGIEATVTLPDGEHVTIQVSTRVPRGRGWANGEPGDDRARTNIKVLGQRVGWVNVDNGNWSLTLRTRRPAIVTAVNALFNYAAHGYCDLTVQEASRCGRCRRTLTDPVSIERGIGPECYGRTTGSRHAAVGPVSDSEVRAQEEAAFASDPDFRRTSEALNLAADAMTATGEAAATGAMERISAAVAQGINDTVAEACAARPPRSRATSPVRVREARELIERALTALTEDELAEPAEVRRALATFDQLAGS